MNDFKQEYQKIKSEYLKGDWKKEKDALKQQLISRPIVLFGCGFFGASIARGFAAEGMAVECFCDSIKHGEDTETKLRIISPEELASKYSDANVVISIATSSTEKEVYDIVINLGFDKNQIFSFNDAYKFMQKTHVQQITLSLEEIEQHLDDYEWAYNFFSDDTSKKIVLEIINGHLFNRQFSYEDFKDSYFPEQFVLGEREVFIDGGLFTGDTTEEFMRRTNNKYSKVIGFDIDETNLSIAYKNLANFPNVQIIAKGLWENTTTKTAELGINMASKIEDGADSTVELISLDEVFAKQPLTDYPTFIKLDIEGSEKQAILGAAHIIKSVAPKLAVCVYHKPEDIYTLPRLIHSMEPEYKFFVKHYTPYIWDTVLYAYKDGVKNV